MKKLLSSMLILTLSLNSFGANCSATSETSEKIKQINNNLAQIKNKTLSETNKEIAKEETKTKTEQKDDSESCENKASGSTVEAQKDATKPVKKSFREKQIEKLNKETKELESMSDKKYLLSSLIKIIGQIAFEIIAYIYIVPSVAFNILSRIENLVYKKYKLKMQKNVNDIIKLILKTLHPDNLKRIKNFDGNVKELYTKAANFQDDYLK